MFKSLKLLILPLPPSQLSLSDATISQILSLRLSSLTWLILHFLELCVELPTGDKSTSPVASWDTCHLMSTIMGKKHTWVGARFLFSPCIILFFRGIQRNTGIQEYKALYSESDRPYTQSQPSSGQPGSFPHPALCQAPSASTCHRPSLTQLRSETHISCMQLGRPHRMETSDNFRFHLKFI